MNFLELSIEALGEAMGVDYMGETLDGGNLVALEAGQLVEVGKDIADNSANLEKFTNALCNLIYKIDIDVREYKSELVSMFVDSTQYGQWLERVKFDINTVIDDPMYNLIPNKDYSSIEHKFYQPKVRAKMFTEGKAIAIPISIQRQAVKTAFHGATEMNNFVAGIRQQIVSQTKFLMDTYAHVVASSAICLSKGPMGTAIHLLSEADEAGITVDKDNPYKNLGNADFMKFAAERMANVSSYFRRPSAAWNNGAEPTWSDKVNLAILTDFANANTFRNLSLTFNEQLVRFPEYDEVVAWQGVKMSDHGWNTSRDEYNLEDLSTVRLTDPDNKLGLQPYFDKEDPEDPESETLDYMTVNWCVGLMYDYKALGVTMFNEMTTSSYTAATDMTTSFTHIKLNANIDTDYNIVAFLLD